MMYYLYMILWFWGEDLDVTFFSAAAEVGSGGRGCPRTSTCLPIKKRWSPGSGSYFR